MATYGYWHCHEPYSLWIHGFRLANADSRCSLFGAYMTVRVNIVRVSKKEWAERLSLNAIRHRREKLWEAMLANHQNFDEISDDWLDLWDQSIRRFGKLYGFGSKRYEDILDSDQDRQIDIYFKLERQGRVVRQIEDRAKWLTKSFREAR